MDFQSSTVVYRVKINASVQAHLLPFFIVSARIYNIPLLTNLCCQANILMKCSFVPRVDCILFSPISVNQLYTIYNCWLISVATYQSRWIDKTMIRMKQCELTGIIWPVQITNVLKNPNSANSMTIVLIQVRDMPTSLWVLSGLFHQCSIRMIHIQKQNIPMQYQ